SRAARHPGPHGRGRRAYRLDGDLLPCPGAAPGRRCRGRRRLLHEPQPGPPRLPPRHGGLLPGQAVDADARPRPPCRGVRGRRLGRDAEVPVVTYATDPAAGADHTARDLRADGYGTVFTADGPRGSRTLRSALPGRHFVANALAASLLLEEIGIAGPQVDHAL